MSAPDSPKAPYTMDTTTTTATATTPSTPNNNNNNLQDVPMESPTTAAAGQTARVSTIDAVTAQTGLLGASSNLVNSIVGAGIIGIPYAIDQAGLVVGIGLLILVAYATDKSLRMIVELASFHPRLRTLGVLTFEDLMGIPFGKAGSNFILLSMFILAYGAMVAYLLIIKDSVPTILGLKDSFIERELVMLVTSLALMVPLSMLRDISSLALTSALSVTADVVLVLIVMTYAPVGNSIDNHGGVGAVLADFWINGRLFIGLGVLSTAMACQHSAFLISGSLEQKTASRWAIVTGRSLAVAAVLSILLGVFGFLGYLEETEGDILNNFTRGSHVVNGARALLSITMVFTYPMESFVARHVVVQLLYGGNMDNATTDADGTVHPESKWMGFFGRREQITLALYAAALVPALIVDDLGPVLSLTGSLGASSIAYISPGLVYIGINGSDFLDWALGKVQNHSSTSNPGDIELPVVGDPTATIETIAQDPKTLSMGRKPWWWWVVGMPIWAAIAGQGERGTKQFLTNLGVPEPTHTADNDGTNGEAEIVGPKNRDFVISILFIVFGVVAAVCGVISNVFVQVNSIFFTPH